jgi:hypothetical protein
MRMANFPDGKTGSEKPQNARAGGPGRNPAKLRYR